MVLETHGFADAHAHVSERGFSDRYPDFDRAVIVFGCTARPSEWDAMAACAVPGTVRFYGVHPWYADEWDEASAGRLESILEEDPRANVGEIGLDGKRGDPSLQRPAFESQLDLWTSPPGSGGSPTSTWSDANGTSSSASGGMQKDAGWSYCTRSHRRAT